MENKTPNTIGAKIRAERKRREWSLELCAGKLGISLSMLHCIEISTRKCKEETRIKAEKVLEISL